MLICIEKNCTCFQHQFLDGLKLNLKAKIKSLVEQPDKLRELRGKSGLTLLHHSVKCGNVEMTEHLIKEGWDVNAQDPSGVTPLMLAVKAKKVKSITVLLKNNADVYITDCKGRSSLQLAVHVRIYKISIETLKQKSHVMLTMIFDVVNDDFPGSNKLTQFLSNTNDLVKMAMVAFAKVEISRFILESGCYSIDYQEPKRGYSALCCAIWFARFENAKLLIERGANINVLDKYGCTPFNEYIYHFAKVDENSEVLKHFLRHSTHLYARYRYDGFTAVESLLGGNKRTLKTVLQSGVDLKLPAGSLWTALMDNPHANVLEVFDELKLEFDVNESDPDGETLLMKAVECGFSKKVEFLLKRGANVNALTSKGDSVLTYANYGTDVLRLMYYVRKQNDFGKIIELLLQYGVNDIQSYFSKKRNLPFCLPMKIIIAHLAMLGAIEQSSLTETTRQIIQRKPQLKNYFDLCTKQLDEMKDLEAYGTVTLFKLLTDKEEKIVVYARNQEFMSAWIEVMDNSSYLETYYLNTLRRKFRIVSEAAKLQSKAAHAIQMLTGINSGVYHIIVYEIISYLIHQDLYNLCEIEGSLYNEEASKQ